jgi:DNA-binding CsgD family transcriptional regulator
MVRSDYLDQRGRIADSTEIMAEGISDTLDAGALNVVSGLTRVLACQLLLFGRFAEGGRVIRQGLALAEGPESTAEVRLAAVLLSTRRGDLEVARQHLQRAREALPDLEDRPGLTAPPILAEHLLAAGRPDQALDMLSRTLIVQSADARVADEMLMWSARSAADLADRGRDRRDGEGVANAQRLLQEVVNLRGTLQPDPFEVIAADDLVQPAMEALFTAEAERCEVGSVRADIWEDAADRCAAAGMRWEQMVMSWRWAQALLNDSPSRMTFAAPLRSAYAFAVEAGAIPLQRELEGLAALGRIRLEEPQLPPADRVPVALRSLTKREREVLAHLVAGRTYAEIADALFISQKTVSAHVSNLLRKTGTSSRREVSALALRLSKPARRVT